MVFICRKDISNTKSDSLTIHSKANLSTHMKMNYIQKNSVTAFVQVGLLQENSKHFMNSSYLFFFLS